VLPHTNNRFPWGGKKGEQKMRGGVGAHSGENLAHQQLAMEKMGGGGMVFEKREKSRMIVLVPVRPIERKRSKQKKTVWEEKKEG